MSDFTLAELPVHLGRSVYLRPIFPADYPMLFAAETGDFLGDRWRQRGKTPSYESFVSTLFDAVVAHYLVVRSIDRLPLGYVTLYNEHYEHGFAYIAATKFDRTDTSAGVVEGATLMIDIAFDRWPLRRLYAVVSEYNLGGFNSGVGRVFEEVARIPEHEYWKGRYWDQVTLMIQKESWGARRQFINRILGRLP